MTWPVTKDDIDMARLAYQTVMGHPCPEGHMPRIGAFLRRAQLVEKFGREYALPPAMHPNDIGELTDEQRRARDFAALQQPGTVGRGG